MCALNCFGTLPDFVENTSNPFEGCDCFLTEIREKTQCDLASLKIFAPNTNDCYDFGRGRFAVRHLTENSLAHRWNSDSTANNSYVIVDDIRRMRSPMPDEWIGLTKLTSFFSYGMKTAASGGRIWGTLTVAYHHPLNLQWRDVVMTCCQLMDAFLKCTRTAFLTDVCQLAYDMQRSNAMRTSFQLLRTFLFKHTQLATVSISLLSAREDCSSFFIDTGGREQMHTFKAAKLDVTEDTVIYSMKKDENLDFLTIRNPRMLSPVSSESHVVAPKVSTEVNEICSAGSFGRGHILAVALRRPKQAGHLGMVTGGPMTLGLPSAGQESKRPVAVLYLQAKHPRVFNQIRDQILSLAPILAELLDHHFMDVDQILQSPSCDGAADVKIIKETPVMKKVKSLHRDIQKKRRENCTTPDQALATTKITDLVSANTSSVVMRGEYSGKAVGVKAIPNTFRNIPMSRLRMELAICVSVIHDHIVRSFAYHLNVNAKQMRDRCPVCTCPPRWSCPAPTWSCQRHIILNTLLKQMEKLRISSWDLLMMEHCDGTLHNLIHQRQLFRDPTNSDHLRNLVLALIDMAKGMSYLHEVGIVHGDFKPENVLFVRHCPSDMDPREWRMKVADFGTSRLGDEKPWTSPDGTLAYRPPEWMLGKARSNNLNHEDGCAADVYSFGITVWEMVEGKVPFGDYVKDQIRLQIDVQNGHRPQFTANWPDQCKRLLTRCWDPNPQARPRFTEILNELEAFLH